MNSPATPSVFTRGSYVVSWICASPFLLVGGAVHMLTIACSGLVSPLPGSIEYIATGKVTHTRKALNMIADADRIIYNKFVTNPNNKYEYRNMF